MDNRSGHMFRGKTRGGKFLMLLVNLFFFNWSVGKRFGSSAFFLGTQEVGNECICMVLVVSSDDKTSA